MKKSYSAVVKNGKIFLNEPTDLPEGVIVELVDAPVSVPSLTEQIEPDKPIIVSSIENSPSDTDSEPENQFKKFGLNTEIQTAIEKVGYLVPTLIQNQAIQLILDQKDVMGIAKTGSGKTAAFTLPILNNLLQSKLRKNEQPQVLIVSPTRELALQIGVSVDTYGRFTDLRQITIFGGVSQKPQVDLLQNSGYSILVATPGRLLDLIGQNFISLKNIRTLILDEADRMLDMGFLPDIKKIVKLTPSQRQTLLFSATMPTEILKMSKLFLRDDFIHVTADEQSIPINKIKQEIYFVEKSNKLPLLIKLLSNGVTSKTLIFTRTKYGADKLTRKLKKQSFSIEAMHGNKSQQARQRALGNFKINKTHILVATDLAARGLDVDNISHVINFDLPREPETYMHRIGRTARAGKSGIAISFCAQEELKQFAQIERLLGLHIPRARQYPFKSTFEEPDPTRITKMSKSQTKSKNHSTRKKTDRKVLSGSDKNKEKPRKHSSSKRRKN